MKSSADHICKFLNILGNYHGLGGKFSFIIDFDLKYDPDKRHPVLKAGMKEQDGIIVEDEKFTDS